MFPAQGENRHILAGDARQGVATIPCALPPLLAQARPGFPFAIARRN